MQVPGPSCYGGSGRRPDLTPYGSYYYTITFSDTNPPTTISEGTPTTIVHGHQPMQHQSDDSAGD